MVRLTIHIRPKDGYSYPGRIKTTEVDSSQRLEQIIADLKLDTKKGIALFSSQGRRELALNSSLASNNIQSGDILETCSSPMLSAVLTAVLEDLNKVQKLLDEERTQERIEPLLGLTAAPSTTNRLDPWPDRWTQDSLKTRTICLAFIKKVIQRHDRFSNLKIPQCQDLVSLHNFMLDKVFTSPTDRRSSMAHIFKPVNKEGEPTTVWQLLQFKLDKMAARASGARTIALIGHESIDNCSVERFLIAERDRRKALEAVQSPQESIAASGRKKPPPGSNTSTITNGGTPTGREHKPKRKRRRLAIESPSARFGDRTWNCLSCKTVPADCMCLTTPCPFHKHPSCSHCFSANHPILQRDHDYIPLDDARAKAVLKEVHRQDRQTLYCPEYSSGPFAILSTLYDQMMNYNQLSLSESRLKELSQTICRSNLYDHQARGRNAFACIEGLMERDLVRMERLPGSTDQEGIYSLLPTGEDLAKYCFTFHQEMNQLVHQNPLVLQGKREVLGSANESNNPISIIVDTREDKTYSNRLIRRCQQESIPSEKRELPAGDYIFTVGDKVCPVVIERKSWSDLADSVLGKGKRRLDCVGIGNESGRTCEHGRCQLCKMKASGCSKVMFVVEGARCSNLGTTTNKCTDAKRCQYCRELQERHGRNVTQEALEDVLYQLQVDHGCFVHYTQSYNETIDMLILMREILGAGIELESTGGVSAGQNREDDIRRAIDLSLGKKPTTASRTAQKRIFATPAISYEKFCSNARRKLSENELVAAQQQFTPQELRLQELNDSNLVTSIFDGAMSAYCVRLCKGSTRQDQTVTSRIARRPSRGFVDLNETFEEAVDKDNAIDSGDSDIEVLDRSAALLSAKKNQSNDSIIEIDSEDEVEVEFNDSQESVQIIEFPIISSVITPRKKRRRRDSDADEIEVLLAVKLDVTAEIRNVCKSISGTLSASSESSILLVYGLCEHDIEMYKDMSEVWKAVYHRARGNASLGDAFGSTCRAELQKVQDTQTPFVDRKSLLFWLLYMQVSCGILVHVMRQKECRQRLESRRNKRGRREVSSVVPAATTTPAAAATEPKPAVKKARLGAPPRPKLILKCIICTEILGVRSGLEVTPCEHTFHSRCLHTWLSSQTIANRRCPLCRHVLGTFKDDAGSTTQQSTPKTRQTTPKQRQITPKPQQSTPRPSCIPSAPNSTSQSLREARLTRFEMDHNPPTQGGQRAGQAAIRPSAVASLGSCEIQDGWDCSKCTFWNKSQDQCCGACCAVQPDRSDWDCEACTLKNHLGTSSCSACGTPNPFCCDAPSIASQTPIIGRQAATYSRSKDATFSNATVKACASLDATYSSKPMPKASKAKCGACGEIGHNRGSAHPDNCRSYFDEEEVELRAKKKEKNKLKARAAREEIVELERNGADRNAQLRDAQRAIATLEQSVAGDATMRQNEVRRLEMARARAEKQARKHD